MTPGPGRTVGSVGRERLAVYPGSFDPLTVAHLAVARAAEAHCERVVLVLSSDPLGKSVTDRPSIADRVAAIERAGLDAAVTDTRLVVDICESFDADAVVLGADKWDQVIDHTWYGGSIDRRDEALRRLPRVLAAPRTGVVPTVPSGLEAVVDLVVLAVEESLANVSSTAARAGEEGHALPTDSSGEG